MENPQKNHYTLATHVYVATLDQDALLLDCMQQQKEKQYVLIKGGTPFFSILLAGAAVSQFSSPGIQRGIDACLSANWIVEAERPISSPMTPERLRLPRSGWMPLRLEAMVLLRRVQHFILHNAFLALVHSLMSLPVACERTNDSRISKMILAVNEAAQMIRTPATCLHQSLAMCWMLRSHGIAAQVAIRVGQDPLMGHMIVVNGQHVMSWKPGLSSVTTLEHFLSATTLLFHSGELTLHYRQQEQ